MSLTFLRVFGLLESGVEFAIPSFQVSPPTSTKLTKSSGWMGRIIRPGDELDSTHGFSTPM